MLLRTPLFSRHQALGGKLIEFGGWEMPVQYSSIVDEHLCVRRSSGVFDICHMGEVFVRGAAAETFLNQTLTNDVRKLGIGMGHYTQMCREDGGTVDDLYAYKLAHDNFLLIVNASRIAADEAWLNDAWGRFPDRHRVAIENASGAMGALAVQGPRTVDFIDHLFRGESEAGCRVASVLELKKNQIGAWNWNGLEVWVARTGYTGEDGFELVARADAMGTLWDEILAKGHVGCIQPIGLGARDTLRTEVCYPLYGHELTETISPIEAGLGFFVSFDKGEFTGRAALLAQKENGVPRRNAAFRMTEKAPPPRPGYKVQAGGTEVGWVASGTQSPSLNQGVGMAFVPPDFATPGTVLGIEIRGRIFFAEVVKKPILKK